MINGIKQLHAISFLLPFAALLTTACTTSVMDEPDTDARAIIFRTPQAETRATVEGSSLTSGNLLVWGWYADADGTNTTNVFDAVQVTGTDGSWTYTDTKYWILGKKYAFYAVYPASLPTKTAVTVNQDGTFTLTDFDCSATGPDAVDLMTATATRTYDGTDNSSVGLSFGHELAWVTCGVTSEVSAVTVKQLRLYGVAHQGTLTRTISPAWSSVTSCTADDTPFKTDTEFTLNSTDGRRKDNVLGDLLLLPQQPDAAVFALTYRYNGDTTDRIATVSLPADTQWKAGERYKYTLMLKAADVILNVTVTSWEEENTSVSWG